MTEIWHCPPDWAAWLTGSLFGLFMGGGIGWWVKGYYVWGGPWAHSQEHPNGDAGGL